MSGPHEAAAGHVAVVACKHLARAEGHLQLPVSVQYLLLLAVELVD